MDWDGSIVDSHLELAGWDVRGDGRGGRIPQGTQDLLDIVCVLLAVDGGTRATDGGVGGVTGCLNGTGNAGYRKETSTNEVTQCSWGNFRTVFFFATFYSNETLSCHPNRGVLIYLKSPHGVQ